MWRLQLLEGAGKPLAAGGFSGSPVVLALVRACVRPALRRVEGVVGGGRGEETGPRLLGLAAPGCSPCVAPSGSSKPVLQGLLWELPTVQPFLSVSTPHSK